MQLIRIVVEYVSRLRINWCSVDVQCIVQNYTTSAYFLTFFPQPLEISATTPLKCQKFAEIHQRIPSFTNVFFQFGNRHVMLCKQVFWRVLWRGKHTQAQSSDVGPPNIPLMEPFFYQELMISVCFELLICWWKAFMLVSSSNFLVKSTYRSRLHPA